MGFGEVKIYFHLFLGNLEIKLSVLPNTWECSVYQNTAF